MTAQEYLDQLINIDRRIKDKLRESAEWRDIAMTKRATIDDVKIQTSPRRDAMEDAICVAVQYEQEAADMAKELTELKHTIIRQIDELKGDEYSYNILKEHYVYGTGLGAMADRYNYTYQGMRKKLQNAVEVFAKQYGNKVQKVQ